MIPGKELPNHNDAVIIFKDRRWQ